MTSERR